MEIDSTTQQKVGNSASAWCWLKALPCSFKAKVTKVAKSIKMLGQDDPRRVTHSLKVGLALTLVSLLYYIRPLFDGFGVSGMWAVLTVVVVFEFTVGGTLSRGLNRGFATLFAGALGVGAQHLASLCGQKGEPIVLGIIVFLLAAASTYMRFFPQIKQRYDYGILIFILTFSLVAVSGYRVDQLLVLAHQRLSTILIGGATCIVISIFLSPVWAGEDLHKLIASNLENLSCYLEGFGGDYFPENKSEEVADVITMKDKSFLQKYKSILNSKTQEDTLANFARWEPGHGRFRLRHPWLQYLKIGTLARQCAYQIEAFNSYIDSNIQERIPQEFQSNIQESCKMMSSESGKALKALASSIKKMTDSSPANHHVEASKNAVKDLKIALKEASLNNLDIQAIAPAATVAFRLIDIVKCVEKISDSVTDLSNLAHFKKAEPTSVLPEGKASHLLHRGSVNPVLDGGSNHVVITISEETDSEIEKL